MKKIGLALFLPVMIIVFVENCCAAVPVEQHKIPSVTTSESDSASKISTTVVTTPPQISSNKGVVTVKVGVQILQLTDLDINTGLFDLDGYIIFVSDKQYNKDRFEFINSYTSNSKKIFEGQNNSSCYRFKGAFRGSLDLSKYPFEKHKLSLQIEHEADGISLMVYAPEEKFLEISPETSIVGVKIKDQRVDIKKIILVLRMILIHVIYYQ